MTDTPTKPLRGFARLSPAERKAVAALGGRSNLSPRQFSRDREMASTAGRKGGLKSPRFKKSDGTI